MVNYYLNELHVDPQVGKKGKPKIKEKKNLDHKNKKENNGTTINWTNKARNEKERAHQPQYVSVLHSSDVVYDRIHMCCYATSLENTHLSNPKIRLTYGLFKIRS